MPPVLFINEESKRTTQIHSPVVVLTPLKRSQVHISTWDTPNTHRDRHLTDILPPRVVHTFARSLHDLRNHDAILLRWGAQHHGGQQRRIDTSVPGNCVA
jgi:hypothetical protein